MTPTPADLSTEALLAEAQARAVLRPIGPYPGWTFGSAWDNPDDAARRAIWEEFRRRDVRTPIDFRWYDGIALDLRLGDDLSRQLFIGGCADPNEFAFLDGYLQPGMVAVDVGANVGLYTLFAARRVGATGTVLAFEPSRREFARLERHLDRNGAAKARAFAFALSDTEGEADLQVSAAEHEGQNTLGGFIYPDVETAGVERVRTRRLDDVLAEQGAAALDFLKVDVEGCETGVLRGAEASLRRFRPLILLEVVEAALERQGSSRAELLDLLRSLDYRFYVFGPDGIPEPADDPDAGGNLLAAPAERPLAEGPRAHPAASVRAQDGPFRPGLAYWNQRQMLAGLRDRILALHAAVDRPIDCHPYQFAQLLAAAADFHPDLILELGRGRGNSLCAFAEASNQKGGSIRIVSLCLSREWRKITAPRLKRFLPGEWFAPVTAVEGNLLTADYRRILSGARRVLVFWDAHGFDIAECVLGEILPLIAGVPHVVLMHDLSDTRYAGPEHLSYEGRGLWRGRNNWTGARVKLGNIDSAVEQSVAALDFATRNQLTLDSADHSIRTDLDETQQLEMRDLLGDLFDTQAHWFYFTLNEHPGPYHFPRFEKPRRWWRKLLP